MVAVLPLATVPIAVWLRGIRGRLVLSAFTAVLIVISIQMAIAYNLGNDKTITQTIAAGLSGWDPSLAFPLLRRTGQSGFDARSLAAWETFSVVVVAAGFWFGGKRAAVAGASRSSPARRSRFRWQSWRWSAAWPLLPAARDANCGCSNPRRSLFGNAETGCDAAIQTLAQLRTRKRLVQVQLRRD